VEGGFCGWRTNLAILLPSRRQRCESRNTTPREFARKKRHERFFDPVSAVTAFGTSLPPEAHAAITGEPVEQEELGA
jgi:hypothetical protein